MKRTLMGLAIAAATSALTGSASAVVFDGNETRMFDIDPALAALDLLLFELDGTPTGQSASGSLRGTLTLGPRPGPSIPSRPEGDVGRNGSAPITFEDILDFDLTLTLPADRGGTPATVPVIPALGAIDLIAGAYTTDGVTLNLNAVGVPTGAPLLQITRDRFPTQIVLPPTPAFPNGQRYGDDVADQLLVQLVAGSVNAVTAAFPDGFGAGPSAVGFGAVTADSTLVLARTDGAPLPNPVPLPGGLLFLASAAGLLFAFGRPAGGRAGCRNKGSPR